MESNLNKTDIADNFLTKFKERKEICIENNNK